MNIPVIVAYKRSPFTLANKGQLSTVRPYEIIAQVIKQLIKESGINTQDIEDLMMGCAFPEGEQGLNIARLVVFLSELPITVGGVTINRFCGSSMQSVHMASANIIAGVGKAYLACGVESMSRIPMSGFNPLPHPALYDFYPQAYEAMGITAENLASKYKIKRKTQEEFALASHTKASKKYLNNSHITGVKTEIAPIINPENNEVISNDGCIRIDANLKTMAGLNPAFDKKGSVTAATSSPLTDGAVAILICSLDYARENNLPILAKIKSFAISGCAPEIMGIGPVGASKKALQRANLSVNDLDIIELNEAFAAQSLAVIEEMDFPLDKVNLDCGAIALGHPLGASGARIVGKAALLLNEHKAKYALATMCIGGGQGIATILESI